MTITTDDDGFRISQQLKKDAFEPTAEEQVTMMDVSTWAEAVEAARPRTARVLTGGPSVEEQWVSTHFSDFNTLTFRQVFDLFHTTVGDPTQTALLVSRLVCVAPGPEFFRFTPSALRVLQEENAGGASEFSEAVSFEYFHRLFGAELLKTEMSIGYRWGRWSKKTDYSCVLPNGTRLAVSVTRAMHFAGEFSEADAQRLLCKKLYGCQMSNRDVLAEDRWDKQVLHIFTETVAAVQLLRCVFLQLLSQQPELVGNTVVLITLTQNAPFLYFNFCTEQANMRFVAPHAELTQRQELFTTAATACSAEEEAVRALLVAESAQQKQRCTEFYYGYCTHEDVWANDAFDLLSKELDGGDEEDDTGLGSLWLEDKGQPEGEGLEQALEALALLEALPYACGGDKPAEYKAALADDGAEEKELAFTEDVTAEKKAAETSASSGDSRSTAVYSKRTAARRRWHSRRARRWHPRRSAGGKRQPCRLSSLKPRLQPSCSSYRFDAAAKPLCDAGMNAPRTSDSYGERIGDLDEKADCSRVICGLGLVQGSIGYPMQKNELALFTASISFTVERLPALEFQAPFSFLHDEAEEPQGPGWDPRWSLAVSAAARIEAAECSFALARMFDDAQ